MDWDVSGFHNGNGALHHIPQDRQDGTALRMGQGCVFAGWMRLLFSTCVACFSSTVLGWAPMKPEKTMDRLMILFVEISLKWGVDIYCILYLLIPIYLLTSGPLKQFVSATLQEQLNIHIKLPKSNHHRQLLMGNLIQRYK